VFFGDDLGGFTQGVDAGDVDGDEEIEVIIGTASVDANLNRIYIYKYDKVNNTYFLEASVNCTGGVAQLSVGDIDNDGRDEIVAASQGIKVFEYVDGELIETFNCAYGGHLEID
jgi:hypothetical protein